MTKYLDRKLARRLVQAEIDRGEKVIEAYVMLIGDRFWNHELIWSGGKWRRQRDFKCFGQSSWDTPSLEILYEDGKQKVLDCYTVESNTEKEK